MDKTITLKELLLNSDKFHITYAVGGDLPEMVVLEKPEEVIEFIKENIYDVDMIVVNEFILDLDKIIEKYNK